MSSGLLSREHAPGVVDHLIRVYPGQGDTQSPVPWPELAVHLLHVAGPELTRELLLRAAEAGCMDRGALPPT